MKLYGWTQNPRKFALLRGEIKNVNYGPYPTILLQVIPKSSAAAYTQPTTDKKIMKIIENINFTFISTPFLQ
jgi:hypothetical protein